MTKEKRKEKESKKDKGKWWESRGTAYDAQETIRDRKKKQKDALDEIFGENKKKKD